MEDEIEMLENVFDSLCALLSEPTSKSKFLIGEGLELMLLMIKQKKMARIKAVKVIDHALLTSHGKQLATHFIDIYGLKTLFSLFMRKGVKTYKKDYKSYSESEEEEHVMSILYSLFKHADSLEMKVRLLTKFLDLEKIDRLFELHFDYSSKVSLYSELDYIDQLEKGLFTLQLVDLILLYCISWESPLETIKQHVYMLLERKKESFDSIKRIVQGFTFYFQLTLLIIIDYLNHLDDLENDKEKVIELLNFISK